MVDLMQAFSYKALICSQVIASALHNRAPRNGDEALPSWMKIQYNHALLLTCIREFMLYGAHSFYKSETNHLTCLASTASPSASTAPYNCQPTFAVNCATIVIWHSDVIRSICMSDFGLSRGLFSIKPRLRGARQQLKINVKAESKTGCNLPLGGEIIRAAHQAEQIQHKNAMKAAGFISTLNSADRLAAGSHFTEISLVCRSAENRVDCELLVETTKGLFISVNTVILSPFQNGLPQLHCSDFQWQQKQVKVGHGKAQKLIDSVLPPSISLQGCRWPTCKPILLEKCPHWKQKFSNKNIQAVVLWPWDDVQKTTVNLQEVAVSQIR